MDYLPSRPKQMPGKTGCPQRLESHPDTVKKAWLNVPTFDLAVLLRKVVAKKGSLPSWCCVRRQKELHARD